MMEYYLTIKRNVLPIHKQHALISKALCQVKETTLKTYTVYDCIYIKFLKGKIIGTGNRSGYCQGLAMEEALVTKEHNEIPCSSSNVLNLD